MKHSKIGEYGMTYRPVEGYKRKDGAYIPPHWKMVKFRWKERPAS